MLESNVEFIFKHFFYVNVQPDDFLLQLFPVIERIDLQDVINDLRMGEGMTPEMRLQRWFKIQD